MRGRRASVVALTLAALTACAGPALLAPPDLPARVEIADVPFHAQEEFYCGPAALAMVLGWSGLAVDQDELAAAVFTPGRTGTLEHDLVAAARRHDRLAVPVTTLDDLLREVAAGHPVLVLQNLAFAWYPQWHYAVVVGYDRPAGELILHSGLEARRTVPIATFARTWERAERWALVVLPPATLPVSADAASVLRAAAGLEQAGRLEAAASAYRTIAHRWPDSPGAFVGLGNVRYAMGDLDAAEAAFRAAVAAHPDAAAAWNNLAHVLAERGAREEALAAVRRALALGGPQTATYRATHDAILDASQAARDREA